MQAPVTRSALRRHVRRAARVALESKRGFVTDLAKEIAMQALGVSAQIVMPRPGEIMQNKQTRQRRVFLRQGSRATQWETIAYDPTVVDLRDANWVKVGRVF